ncbi:tripartite motif-containing protein 2-like [Antedon mediterranea]|uniref:tripartite motif-containing protein 2-like n=1 Tax=Antedon mediterranea TaxID=105859 RepID=UPI003AF963AB
MASKDLSLLGNIDEKVLECSICNGRLEDPKLLSCHHSFCLKCLEKWVDINNGKLTCPNCRKINSIPVGGLQKLSPNTLLNNLLEIMEQHEIDENEFTAVLCLSHTQPLQMYFHKCKEPVCIVCTQTKCTSWFEVHEQTDIVTAFKMFKESSEELKKAANESIHKMENVLKVVTENTNKLEETKKRSLADIDNTVQEMVQTIHQKGDEMKKEVENIYKNEKEGYDAQIEKMLKINSELNTNFTFLNHLLKSERLTVMKSGEIVLKKLRDQIDKFKEIEENDSTRQINFIGNKRLTDILKGNNIGNVTTTPLVIRIDRYPQGIAKFDDYILVSFGTNAIHEYRQSGEYVSKITLPEGVKVERMYKMKNDHIAFCDDGHSCIQVCDMNGHMIKSIGKGVLENPFGIHIDESANVIYVTDFNFACVFVFDISSGKLLKRIEDQNKLTSQYLNVTLTRTGNLLITDLGNDQLLLYDDRNRKLKVIIDKGDEDGKVRFPHEVLVDQDDNIIIASIGKLQLFGRDGHFIKRIDQGDFSDWSFIIPYDSCFAAIKIVDDNLIFYYLHY